MTKSAFLRTVQSRTARVAIGASTVRGRGNTGTVAAARAFLRSLPLQRFALRNAIANVPCNARVASPRGRRLQRLPISLVNLFAPKYEEYFVDLVVGAQEIFRRFQGNLRGLPDRVTVSAATDCGKGNRFDSIFNCEL